MEGSIASTGKDRLLILLDNSNKNMHQAIILTLWKVMVLEK
jgi:hypothetical protein